MSTLLIIGATGELGIQTVLAAQSNLASAWSGKIIATHHNSPPPHFHTRVTWIPLDCSDHKAVRTTIASQSHLGAVIYCAVPKHGGANSKHSSSVRLGIVDDVVNCAEATVMVNARFIAVSTDLVFDGNLSNHKRYSEADQANPTNAYGKYKHEMEQALLKLSGNIIIARTSLILTMPDQQGKGMGKGIQFVVDCLQGKKGTIQLFEDELRCMSWSDDLGRALIELAKPDCNFTGLIHLVSDQVTNRWQLAKALAKKLRLEHQLGVYAKNGLSKESGMNRPLNCALSTVNRRNVLKTKFDGVLDRLPL